MYRYSAYTSQQDGTTFEHPGPLRDAIRAARDYAHNAFPAWGYRGYGPKIVVADAETGERVHEERAWSFGARIREVRESRGMTQAELAEALKTDQPYVSRLESGRSEPKTTMLRSLATALDVSTDYLLGLDNGGTQ